MKITSILVLIKTHGPDEVFLNTDLPSPFPPEVSDEPLSVKFAVRATYGLEYVKKHFSGISTEVIDMTTGKRNPIKNPVKNASVIIVNTP